MFSKLRTSLYSALVCSISLLATASLAQTTLHVGPGQPYSTIQSGIDAASNGDTVLVAPGTYNENINFKGKAITVTSSGGATVTTIDGGGVGSTVTMTTQEPRTAVLSNFTITHGGPPNPSPLGSGGAGITIANSAPTILNNIVTQNYCQNIHVSAGAPLIQGNIVSSSLNAAQCGVSYTGGINIGGTYSSPSGALPPVVFGNLIENNTTGQVGDGGGDGGAGVWDDAANNLVVESNIIRNNTTRTGLGGGILVVNASPVAIANNLIYGNSAGCGGGGIAYQATGPGSPYNFLIANNTIADNTSTGQGGYSNCAAIAQIYPGPYSYGLGTPTTGIINNIISGSTSYPAINCSWYSTPSESNQPTFQNNVLYNAGGPFFGSYCVDVSGKYNNIAADPQFANPSTGDYHLKSTSPALDAGQNIVLQAMLSMVGTTLFADLDGKQRIQDATGKGCIIDMGAYEYPGPQGTCSTSGTLTASPNPSIFGQTVTFTAQLSSATGVPTGNVQFSDGGTVLGTAPVSSTGAAIFSTSQLSVGTHNITATYQPTGLFAPASAIVTEVVNGYTTTTALTCSPTSIYMSQSAHLAAMVTSVNGTPTGSVTFTDNGATLATQTLANGAASLTYTGSTAGTHTLTATYTPTGAFGGSSASCSETVNLLPSTSTLSVTPVSSTYGSPVTLIATVAPATPPGPGTPSGTVTFSNAGSNIGTATVANGSASLTLTTLPGGTDNLTCTYSGSNIYASSSCNSIPVLVNAAATALTLTSSNNPATALTPITFTATLSSNGKPAPAGNTITLTVNGQTVTLTTNSTGSATYTTSTLTPNTYPVTATFPGTSSLLGSTASLTQVVSPAPTTTSLTASPNPAYATQTVTFTATVAAQGTSAQPTSGTVTFYDGTTSLGTQSLSASSTAALTLSTLAVGTHPITAAFTPANNTFLPSTSPVVNEVILASGFTITLAPSSIVIPRGASATVAIHLASVGNFAGPLALSYGTLPANATAFINPATVTLTAGGTGSSTFSLNTLLKSTGASHIPTRPGSRTLPEVLAALALFIPLGLSRRKNLSRLLGLALLAIALQTTTGCTNAWYTAATVAPGTYQLPIIATDVNHNTQTATLTITVTP